MRKLLLTVTTACCLLLPAGFVSAQSEMIDGQVVKVDESAGKITIKHGATKGHGMQHESTAAMVFKANDPALLKQVKAGDKIRFESRDVNGQLTITKIEKTK